MGLRCILYKVTSTPRFGEGCILAATGVILRKDGPILKQEVFLEVEPYYGEFIYYSSCKWDDDYTFSLYSKEGKNGV
jgi:hypothetical protein